MRFNLATWIGPTVNETDHGMVEVRGLVEHIQDGNEQGTESWFHNPGAQASSHFLNPKTGRLRQMVDTANRAWAEAAGNSHWISIENEGKGGDSLTDSQIENNAQLYAWLVEQYKVPLESTNDPNGHGLGWHGMGGDAWGGHFDCPGEHIKAQRPLILARAAVILKGTGTPAPPPKKRPPFPTGLRPNYSTPSAKELQVLLKATSWLGQNVPLNNNYGPLTQKAVAGFNEKHGLRDAGKSYDPAIGPHGWALLCELAGAWA